MIADWIGILFVVAGTGFMVLAGLAIVRMPDIYTRMSGTTKAGTLGLGLILLGMVVHFGELGVAVRAVAVIFFGFLTAPIAAHMIARAAYLSGAQLWEGTLVDEMAGQYHPRTHALASGEHGAGPAASDREATG